MSINIPILLMMVLTMIVWVVMAWQRIAWARENKASIKRFSTRADADDLPYELRKVADNFKNLFELPVVFYALCFYLAWGNEVGVLEVILAYVFVASRYVHSWIQIGYNRVMHRLYAHLVGAIALWIMLILTVWGILFY